MSLRKDLREEIRALSRRLSAKGGESTFKSMGQIGRYRQLAEEAKLGPAVDDAILEQAIVLLNNGRLCEALLSFEKRLLEAPFDFTAQQGWKRVRSMVHDQMLKLADADPECAEFGRTYEKLLEQGYVSNCLHLGAVRYYIASGLVGTAEERLLAFASVAPGAPGVAELVLRLAALSDNVRIQQLSFKYREAA